MGKKAINQQEKLAKANASSSARAAQSLGATTGFIGFSAFATTAPPAVAEATASPAVATAPSASFSFYDGADTDIALALKMLGKRDAQTKTKALLSLKDTVIPSRKPIELRPAVGQYCYLYGKLMLDNDRRVRQLANDVLGALIDRMKKGTVFHNHMPLLLPHWYVLGMHDSHTDTAQGAARAFRALIPDEADQTALLTTHVDLLLTHIKTYLDATVDSLSDRALCSADEAEERYERCVTSAILSGGALLSALPSIVVSSNENARVFLASVGKCTTLASKSATFSRASIRHASFHVFTTASTAVPALLRDAVEPRVVLGVVGEKFAANLPAVWTLVLTYLHAMASLESSCALPWSSLVPNIVPKVVAMTKHAFYGATSSMSNLLPFLSLLPVDATASVDLLAALVKALESPHVLHGQSHVVAAFAECLLAAWTILPSPSPDHAAYVEAFADVVVAAWTKALSPAITPDRAFSVFARAMTDLQPRLVAFQSRHDDSTVPTLGLSLAQRAVDAALRKVVGSDARVLATLRLALEAYAADETLLNTTHRLCHHLVADQLLADAVSGRTLQILAQLLDMVPFATLFPDPAAGLAAYHRAIVPAFALDKASFFHIWKHFAPHAPDVLWPQLLQLWDRDTDAVMWKAAALASLPSLAPWSSSTSTLPLYDTIWKSHWFDTRVLLALAADDVSSAWTDDETAFFGVCWGDAQPLVSPATIRQVLTWCTANKDTPKGWTVLDTLLPLLVASGEWWSETLSLVDAVVANIPFHSQAKALWEGVLQPSVATAWPVDHQTTLKAHWLAQLTRLYDDETTCSAAQWAVLCGDLVELDASVWPQVPLTHAPPSYRQLECMAELCHRWANHHETVASLLTPAQLAHWLALDVGFALTWYVVDADPAILSEHVGAWLEPYLMLGDLWNAVGDQPLAGDALVHLLTRQGDNKDEGRRRRCLAAILSAHVDATTEADGTVIDTIPARLDEWTLQVLLEHTTDAIVVSTLPRILDTVSPSTFVAALPRFVHATLATDETALLDPLMLTSLTTLASSPLALEAVVHLTHLVPLLEADDSWSSVVASVVDAIGRRATSPTSSVVSVAEWLTLTTFVAALLASPSLVTRQDKTTQHAWFHAARALLVHAFAAKQDTSDVVALKLHSTRVASLHHEPHVLPCRRALLQLVDGLARHGQDHSTVELARHHREAIALVAIRTIDDAVHLKPTLHVEFAASKQPAAAWSLIVAAHDVHQSLAVGLLGLHHVLAFVDDDGFGALVLQVLEGRDSLWLALTETVGHPTLQAALYGLLRLTSLEIDLPNVQDLVNVDADDEAATETALAELLITPGLAQALTRSAMATPATTTLAPLLVWDLFLRMFPSTTSPLVTSALGAFVTQHHLLGPFLTLCGHHLQAATKATASSSTTLPTAAAVDAAFPTLSTLAALDVASAVAPLAAAVFYRTVVKLPTMVRLWWNDDCTRSTRSWVAKFCEENVSPLLLVEEIRAIQVGGETALWDADEMTVRGSKVSREITTTYLKDECTLEMVIRVPPSYPLRSVEVECTKRIGISEERWRRWVLQILKVTASQDGSLLDAVLLWKSNVDKEFDGVEPCPICFSILNPKTMGLPNLQCRTCSNKYHNSCLYKWFNQSSKNKCPICQQPFC
ncbi:Aste57867_10886 [Aphanomyces stellatus]|uniref:E3 ubiquitin-protein ligase listerin n=1 Tax=Aphanomyces stellatus TaxID=120398 RepID=A0A485KRY7_9STRA|nr:hypothetical protein As57867_010846 [Aphanomyces stellatus]VFT87754.1 Aste57867_10886 [Aphanomyces stellatus]